MTGREKWRYVHALTIYQIALLIEGYDPSDLSEYPNSWNPVIRSETAAVLAALRTSVEDETIPLHKGVYQEGYGAGIDYQNSLIHVEALLKWMKKIGLRDRFFDPEPIAISADNPFGRFYAPKLAAANAAWEAVTSDSNLLRGKSPKKAIEDWLKAHAAEFDLLNKDGTPNATGIEEIAKVANWKPGGGAPATPKSSEQGGEFKQTQRTVAPNPTTGFAENILNDEIPF